MEDVPERLTVVICTKKLPKLEAWNADLAENGLDVVITSTSPAPDDAQRLAARVCGELVMLTFATAPMGVMHRPKDWFPAGRSLVQHRKGAAMLAWWRSNEWAGAAAWCIASALARLTSGYVFEWSGSAAISPIEPSVGYERAKALVDALPRGPEDWELDVEASTEALTEQMLRYHDELLERGEKPAPDEP